MKSSIDLVKEYVDKMLFTESTGHDYFHAIRVMNNAVQISKDMDVNIKVIKAAALTHDLIDKKVSTNIKKSLEDLIIQLNKAKYSQIEIDDIIHIIENISYSKMGKPTSLEGKIVQDADRLDALGAIGIARTFAFGGKNQRVLYNPASKDNLDSISHFHEKLLKLEALMNTKEARDIAHLRTKFMIEYLKQFHLEWEGKDFN